VSRVVEAYYTVPQVATLLNYSTKWVVLRVQAGEFGPGCFFVDKEYRIPASGVNEFIARHGVRPPAEQMPVRARTMGELRRKLRETEPVQTSELTPA